jgi:hypothetical protein
MAKYRKYDPDVKSLIIETRNPNLFPELNIPRTTALYWIKSASKKRKKTAYKTSSNLQIKNVAKKLEAERYKTFIVSEILKRNLKQKGKEGRREIVKYVDEAKMSYGINYAEMCRLIGIHVVTLKDWRIELHGCNWKFKKCEINNTNGLLEDEKKSLISMLTDKDFAHYSLKSLCYYAKRKGLVHASMSTWYKYMKMNEIIRPGHKKYKIKNSKSLRANDPNEYWHIDVTEFKLRGGKKLYLQLIVDNYSRAVIDYSLNTNKKAENTIYLIKKALSKQATSRIMSDAGTENCNHGVRKVLFSKNVKHLVAGKNTDYRNSMVESVIRSIKRKRKTFLSETKVNKVKAYIEDVIYEYNNIIPHSALEGGTPREVYDNRWGQTDVVELKSLHIDSVSKRKEFRFQCDCS